MEVIKTIRPSRKIEKDAMLHILGGMEDNGNSATSCSCSGSGDNSNSAFLCKCSGSGDNNNQKVNCSCSDK